MLNRIVIVASLFLATLSAFPALGAEPQKDEHGKILTATCRDGKTYWHPTGEKRGACSGHGGVAAWADGSPVKSHERKTEYK